MQLTLFDRLEVIKTINKEYNLEKNAYISFSGGKDSTVLHHLIDIALPDNNIPRVFINTGIEYTEISKFVKEMAANDKRIIIINSNVNIVKMLETKGYPFKSKEHSNKWQMWKKGSQAKSVIKYINSNNSFACPKSLLYQFKKDSDFKLNISDNCCKELKKNPIKKWQSENNRTITLTGMRKSEGGQRTTLNCVVYDKERKLLKFHPLSVLDNQFIEWFIKEHNIKLCSLYYEPFNFIRTGCLGCPFALNLQEQLETLEKLLPNERKRCEMIWSKVYKEYRKRNYRLKTVEQLKLF